MDKGQAGVDLPAVDLPVSRTGLELHYSPRFRIDLQPGTFRVENEPGEFAEALRQPAAPVAGGSADARDASGLQSLVERYRNERGGRAGIGSLPVDGTVSGFRPSIFLASELAAGGGP